MVFEVSTRITFTERRSCFTCKRRKDSSVILFSASLEVSATQRAARRCSSKALPGIVKEGWDLNANPSEISADTYHHFVCRQFSGEPPVSFVFACLPCGKGEEQESIKEPSKNPLIHACPITRTTAQCVSNCCRCLLHENSHWWVCKSILLLLTPIWLSEAKQETTEARNKTKNNKK